MHPCKQRNLFGLQSARVKLAVFSKIYVSLKNYVMGGDIHITPIGPDDSAPLARFRFECIELTCEAHDSMREKRLDLTRVFDSVAIVA